MSSKDFEKRQIVSKPTNTKTTR